MKTGLALTGPAHQTMSSKSISELTNKRHDSIKRTMEMLYQQGAISQPQIVDGIRSANGIVEKVYLVNKRDSFVVVAQVCPEFTAALVDRWQALEEQVRNPPEPVFKIPKDFSDARPCRLTVSGCLHRIDGCDGRCHDAGRHAVKGE